MREDYTRNSPFRSFDPMRLPSLLLHDNLGCLPILVIPFLVVATVDPAAENTPRELATAFSVYRAREFCAQTRFVPGTTSIQVLKEPLTSKPIRPVLISNGTTITHRMDASIYRPGRQLLWRLLKAMRAHSKAI